VRRRPLPSGLPRPNHQRPLLHPDGDRRTNLTICHTHFEHEAKPETRCTPSSPFQYDCYVASTLIESENQAKRRSTMEHHTRTPQKRYMTIFWDFIYSDRRLEQHIHTASKRLPAMSSIFGYPHHARQMPVTVGSRCPRPNQGRKKTNLVTRYPLSGVGTMAHGTSGVRSVGRRILYNRCVLVVDGVSWR
jgi:hypothetical protein